MDTRSTLHWSALLLALFAASWMLVSVAGALIVVLPLFAVAGFILLLVHARRLDAERKTLTLGGGALGLIVYGLWMLLFLLSQSVSIKDAGNWVPPAALGDAAEALGAYLPILGAIALLIGFWSLWQTRERAMAATGTVLVAIVQITAVFGLGGGTAMATALQVFLAVGFLLLALALVLPLSDPDKGGAPWHGNEAT